MGFIAIRKYIFIKENLEIKTKILEASGDASNNTTMNIVRNKVNSVLLMCKTVENICL